MEEWTWGGGCQHYFPGNLFSAGLDKDEGRLRAMRCKQVEGAAQEQGIGNANALNTFIIGSFAAVADLLSFCSRVGWVLELLLTDNIHESGLNTFSQAMRTRVTNTRPSNKILLAPEGRLHPLLVCTPPGCPDHCYILGPLPHVYIDRLAPFSEQASEIATNSVPLSQVVH